MDTTANPMLSVKSLQKAGSRGTGVMTKGGTLAKIGLMTAVLIAAAVWGWTAAPTLVDEISTRMLWIGGATLFIVGLVAAIKSNAITVLLYAAMEGFYLGLISRAFDAAWNGIVTQAVLITLSVALVAYLLYSSGVVKVGQKFQAVTLIATLGILVFMLVEFILSFFVPDFIGIATTGTWGMVIGLVVVLVAALNLFTSYAVIDQGVEAGAPKQAEWYGAFGLAVTLIWLYVSILQLLATARGNN